MGGADQVDFTPSWKLFKEGEFLLDYPGDPEPAKMAAWIGEPVAPPPPPPAYIVRAERVVHVRHVGGMCL